MVLSGRRAGAGALVLWAVPVADLGGVARHVLDAVRARIPGWRLVVLCPEGPLAQSLRSLGAPVVTGPVSPEDGMATAARTLRRTLRALRPDVLHTHLAFADLIGVAAATGLRSGSGRRLRVVSTEHGISGVPGLYQSGAAEARAKQLAHRARLLRTDQVIAVSDSTAQQIAAQWGNGAKVKVIRNGVDAPVPAPHPQPGLRILSLARLAPEKRIDQLLSAFALLAADDPGASLTLAGTGPESAALHGLVAELELGDRVRFAGHLEADLALREHDVVAQLSAWENLSYSLLDAVAHGLGVVATDVGGNREIIPERCLVDATDRRAVARAMAEQGMTLERRPPAGVERDVRSMCRGIAGVYAEVLG